MAKKLIFFFLILLLIKKIFWSLMVPIWQLPDEPAHFARIQFFAEKGKIFPRKNDLQTSKELEKSLKLLEIESFKWDSEGFGRHQLNYQNSLYGYQEKELLVAKKEEQTQFIATASAWATPPLYYFLATPFYKIFQEQGIINRVFALRLFSTLLGFASTGLVYLSALKIYKKSNLSLLFALFFSYLPMFSFISSGINPDNLANFLSLLFLYLSLDILEKEKSNSKEWILLFSILVLAIFTKLTALFLIPMFLVLIFLKFKNRSLNSQLGLLLIPSQNDQDTPLGIFKFFKERLVNKDLLKSLLFYGRENYYYWRTRTFPGFWGIFVWGDVAYPTWVYNLLFKITPLALIGYLAKTFKSKRNRELWYVFIFGLVNLTSALIFDWWRYQTQKEIFGVQGRYFFPSLFSFLFIFYFGLTSFFGQQIGKIVSWLLTVLMIGLNTFGLFLLVKRFYLISDFSNLIQSLSQYKPIFFKGWWVSFWLVLYLISLIMILVKTFFLFENKKKK